jgi:hypothetical protein
MSQDTLVLISEVGRLQSLLTAEQAESRRLRGLLAKALSGKTVRGVKSSAAKKEKEKLKAQKQEEKLKAQKEREKLKAQKQREKLKAQKQKEKLKAQKQKAAAKLKLKAQKDKLAAKEAKAAEKLAAKEAKAAEKLAAREAKAAEKLAARQAKKMTKKAKKPTKNTEKKGKREILKENLRSEIESFGAVSTADSIVQLRKDLAAAKKAARRPLSPLSDGSDSAPLSSTVVNVDVVNNDNTQHVTTRHEC